MGLKVKELLTVFLRIDTRLHQESTEKEWNTIINANRIAGAEVTIEGTKYLLDKNDNQNNLHSGFNRLHVLRFNRNIVECKCLSIYLIYQVEEG